ncbi:hypothetical protein TNCV_1224201 [Trichonephila clavipes]|nr:hypothetical protein TNCV_1224201 [Trichonephila clavipes]
MFISHIRWYFGGIWAQIHDLPETMLTSSAKEQKVQDLESKLPFFSNVNAIENRLRLRIEGGKLVGWGKLNMMLTVRECMGGSDAVRRNKRKEKWSYRSVALPVGGNRCLSTVHHDHDTSQKGKTPFAIVLTSTMRDFTYVEKADMHYMYCR